MCSTRFDITSIAHLYFKKVVHKAAVAEMHYIRSVIAIDTTITFLGNSLVVGVIL